VSDNGARTLVGVTPREGSDRLGRGPLHYAALEDDLAGVEALLASGADPNASDRQGMTPLHFAAQEGSLRVAALLLGSGADVDVVDAFGNAPLMTAVFNSRGAAR